MNINAPLLDNRHGFRARVPLNAINSLVLVVFLFALSLIGCSGGGSSTSSSPIFPIDTHNPISKVAQSGSVLTAENRIPIYSRVSQRVGLLDPLSATEVWSRSAPDFEFGIALHDLSGVALFGRQRIEIVAPNVTKAFSLSGTYYHVVAAARHASFAAALQANAQIELVHALGGGDWQHAVFDLPWRGEAAAPESEVLLFLNDYGTQLTAFSMVSGRYAVFNSPRADGTFSTTSVACAGPGKPPDASYLFTAATWIESANVIAAVDRAGVVHLIAVNEACVEFATRTSLSLLPATASRITSLQASTGGSILALAEGGDVLRLAPSTTAIASVERILDRVCASPIAALALPANRLLVVCARVRSSPSSVSSFLDVQSVELNYQTFDLTTKALLASIVLLQEETAGSGLNPEQFTLYRATESSLGNLESYSLLTGEKKTTTGIFVRGLLDRL